MRGTLGTADAQGEVRADVLEQPRRQRARGRADLPLRLARRLVRRRPAGLPRVELGWSFWQTGGFLAVWVIGYGAVQAAAPRLLAPRRAADGPDGDGARVRARGVPGGDRARARGASVDADARRSSLGLIVFGVVFALNSAVHSYLILALRRRRQGRDERRLLLHGERRRPPRSGRCSRALLYQWRGLEACLWASVAFVLGAGALSLLLPRTGASLSARALAT